jgi:hypothetical protein
MDTHGQTFSYRAQCCKKIIAVICECLKSARVFDSGMPFQPSLMFMCKTRSLPYKRAPERCFTRVGLRLTYTQTRLHRLPRDKHSNIRKSRPQKVLQHWAQDKTWAEFSALEVAVWVI